MRHFIRMDRWRPWVPLVFAVGVLVGDATFAVRPIMGYFEESSIWPREPFVYSLLAYLVFATVLDLLAWRLVPASRRHPLLRLLFLCGVGTVLTLAAGEVRSLPILPIVLAFGVVGLGRFTWPVAGVGFAAALWPLFLRPAPPAAPAFTAVPTPGPRTWC